MNVPISRTLTGLMLLVGFSVGVTAQNPVHATHVLGFEGLAKNANGDLAIQDGALRFESGKGSTAQITLGSIQDVFLGQQDKQTGGTTGHAIDLVSHKKYDTLTLEYLDPDGGVHGAIFQLDKGQGQVLRNALVAEGVHVGQMEDQITKLSTQERKKMVR